MKWLIYAMLLAACGPQHSTVPTHEIPGPLLAKRDLYLNLVQREQGHAGFVGLDACDSVLYSGLLRVGGAAVDLTAARLADGSWTRNPTRDCYADGGSDSTFSRDMYLGLLWYAYTTRDLPLVQSILDYCNAHTTNIGVGCVFGKGSILDPKYIISPNLLATTHELLKFLGGEDHPFARNVYTRESTGLIGFQAHLAVIHILLRGAIIGHISSPNLDVLHEQADRQPKNALFQLAYHKFNDGILDEAYRYLLTNEYFPLDRLPSSDDRCEPYLFQRDMGADWEPCNDHKIHPGVDFLFAMKMLEI